jgi:copper chaperone NosL
MGVSDLRTAAQLVAPLEEPRLFDDVGCLRDYLGGGATIPEGAVAYVADHRTRQWVPAVRAVYVQTSALATPMSSGIAAWSDAASRAGDTGVPEAAPVRFPAEIFGAARPPGGAP